MRIDLRQLFDIVGERKTFDLSLDFSDEEYNGAVSYTHLDVYKRQDQPGL